MIRFGHIAKHRVFCCCCGEPTKNFGSTTKWNPVEQSPNIVCPLTVRDYWCFMIWERSSRVHSRTVKKKGVGLFFFRRAELEILSRWSPTNKLCIHNTAVLHVHEIVKPFAINNHFRLFISHSFREFFTWQPFCFFTFVMMERGYPSGVLFVIRILVIIFTSAQLACFCLPWRILVAGSATFELACMIPESILTRLTSEMMWGRHAKRHADSISCLSGAECSDRRLVCRFAHSDLPF